MQVPLPIPILGQHFCPLWVHSLMHGVLGLIVGIVSIFLYEHWFR